MKATPLNKVNYSDWIKFFFNSVHLKSLKFTLPDWIFLLNLFHQYKDLISDHHNMENFLRNHKLSDIIYLKKYVVNLLLRNLNTLNDYIQIQLMVQTIWY